MFEFQVFRMNMEEFDLGDFSEVNDAFLVMRSELTNTLSVELKVMCTAIQFKDDTFKFDKSDDFKDYTDEYLKEIIVNKMLR